MGGQNTKPNGFEVLNQLRLLTTSKDPNMIDFQEKKEVEAEVEDEVVTHTLFHAVGVANDENKPEENNEESFHMNYVGEQGLSYVAGFIAMKLHKKFPVLGSKDLKEATSRWISLISYGGLFHPSVEFMEACKLFECEFCKFHGETVSTCINPIETFACKLTKQFPEWDSSILMLFSKTRFFIRIKSLNKKHDVDVISNKSRAKKQIAHHL